MRSRELSDYPTAASEKRIGDSRLRYTGVYASHGKYAATVKHRGRDHWGGLWPTARAAAIARDRLVLHLGLVAPLNLPRTSAKLGQASPEELRREARALQRMKDAAASRTSSPYFGVAWSRFHKSWLSQVLIEGRVVHLGRFDDSAKAARVRDQVVLYLRRKGGRSACFRPLNFPHAKLSPLSIKEARLEARRLLKANTASRYRGVTRDPKKPRKPWVASINPDRVSLYLGAYATEREAALAYDRAALHYFGNEVALNFPKLRSKLVPADVDVLQTEAFRQYRALTKSRFRGVYAPAKSSRWAACIYVEKKRKHLGMFDTEEEAAVAYDRAAVRKGGAKMRLNFDPVTGEERCGARINLRRRSNPA